MEEVEWGVGECYHPLPLTRECCVKQSAWEACTAMHRSRGHSEGRSRVERRGRGKERQGRE